MAAELQKQNIFLIIFFVIITFGIYIPVWFLNRKSIFNSLNSKDKISNDSIFFILSLFIISVVLIVPSVWFMETTIGHIVDAIDSILSFIGSIGILIISFKVRRILNDHYETNLSWLATLFFSLYYLQYKINRLVDKA